MAQTCPISFQRIDANLVRIIALQVLTIGIFLLFTENIFLAFLLLFDFSVRVLSLKFLSPLGLIGKLIITYFKLTPQPCDEAPKRFALYLGLAIIGFFTLLFLFSFTISASILVLILLICAFLETVFDYCIGCKIYHYSQLIMGRE